jgi:hypothetical protein
LVGFFHDEFSYNTHFVFRTKVLTQFKIQDLVPVYSIPPALLSVDNGAINEINGSSRVSSL